MVENKQETTPSKTPEEQSRLTDFADRMVKVYSAIEAKSPIMVNRLRATFDIDRQAFQEMLDNFVEEVAHHDPVFQDAFDRLMEARKTTVGTKRATELVEELNEIRTHLKDVVVSDLGLPDEVRISEMELAHNRVQDIIEEAKDSGRPLETPRDIIIALGIREPKEDGKDAYTFPFELMPPAVIDKWNTYIATVLKHEQAQADMPLTSDSETLEAARKTVETLAQAREFAHGIVTADVEKVLGLTKMPNWTLRDTRQLLSNIRDYQLPTIEITTSPTARKFVAANTDSVMVAEALVSEAAN